MITRIAIVAGILLSAGVARAAATSVPPAQEKILESAVTTGAPYIDLTRCTVDSRAVTAALLQVPDEDRGTVLPAGSCRVATERAWPTKVSDVDRR